ncbi:MAG: diadenylate cyclase CdaA [Myxococcota bacterium]|nr:diadenylate cyclase CdaA [Myxococcota bacterium]
MIEFIVEWLTVQLLELSEFLESNFDPVRDTADILVVALALYWMLLLIRGTRAVQIVIGIMALVAIRLLAEFMGLSTLSWIFDTFLAYAPLMIVVLFQADIRRALARVGRGFFPRLAQQQTSQAIEETVQATRTLADQGAGALIVLERETRLEDLIEVGAVLDAEVTKELLVALFQASSPLHDGAVILQDGRLTHAGCILPLTLRTDLPEGVGTRHRAAVGITEESDAVVVVVSEETRGVSVVHGGDMIRNLDGPRLRSVLSDLLTRPAGGRDPDNDLDDDLDGESRGADVVPMR